MSSLYNRARVSTATAGTGTITLGAATSNAFFTFAEAGVPDGAIVSYVIEDGSNVELGIGTYTLSGTTLARTTVTASKISGAAGTTKLTLSGSAVVYIDALAADIIVSQGVWSTDSTGNLTGLTNLNGNISGTITNSNTGASAAAVLNVLAGNAQLNINAKYADSTTYISAPAGQLFFVTNSAANVGFGTNNVTAMTVDASQNVGIGTTADRRLHAEQDSAATSAVSYVGRLTSTSSGTPANGIGAGVEFEVEAQAGVNKVGGTIESYAYNVGAGTEGFETVFKTMSAGAAATERGRTGFMPVNMIQNDSLTLLASNSMVVSTQYTLPTGVNLTMGANSVMRIL